MVQRVPVRIALAPEDLAQHPLRVGLSITLFLCVLLAAKLGYIHPTGWTAGQ